MNTITTLFSQLSVAEQAALQATHDSLAPQWDAHTDPEQKGAIELQFTEALNTFRSNYDL